MKCGDIVLLYYPFTDGSATKLRPAVVVSTDEYNRRGDIVVVPISSSPASRGLDAMTISEAASCFAQSGLKRESHVKWTKPFTLDKRMIRRRLGSLQAEPLAELQAKIRSLFGA